MTKLETLLIHGAGYVDVYEGAQVLPIFQSTIFEGARGSGYHGVRYPRLNNLPNQLALAQKLAAIEHGEQAVLFSSGMAAISTSLLTVLNKGSHLIAQPSLYGGTHSLLTQDFKDFGINVDWLDLDQPQSWDNLVHSQTRAVYVEAIGNPLLEVPDHQAIVEFAKRHRLVSIIDNTFASPINFSPLTLGYDLSLHSATKYLNGHSDLVAGAAIGPRRLIEPIKHRLNHLGGFLDPHGCFMLDRGLKTLALRVRQQNESALHLARFFAERREVKSVRYPGLEAHPDHAHARRYFSGFGGMLTVELTGNADTAMHFINALKVVIRSASLGGVETLVTLPARTSHAGLTPDERQALGIAEGLVRVSVGIEAVLDLEEDFDQAFCVAFL